ncbi:protein croquemort-like [Lucilia sericata]|uniref:protein croquemort-like n=1 Tax=Lucilia sericata TaxID=13632 RepID=UPI0018A87832|nr:protein croquemort-like [Lucilia sericata]
MMPKRSPRLMIKSTRKYVKYLTVLFVIFLALVGVFCTVFSKIFVNRFIDSYMILRPGNKIVDMWLSPDVNVTIDIHFFNWTNSEDFYKTKVKPKVEEVGPYSFLEIPKKEIFQWHPENNTVDYGKKHWYYFDETKSERPLEDKLVTVNGLLVAAASKTRDWNYVKRAVVDMALRLYKNGIVWKHTAEEFFFKGFEDNIVNLLSIFPSSFRSSMGIFVPWDRIGFIYGRNGSTDLLGTHTISTGAGNMDEFGQIVLWKGKNYSEPLPQACSSVKGSAGEFQKTNLKKNESIQYFFSDFCRTINLDYVDEYMVEGIKGYRYIISPNTFDNGTLNPANECFCNGECLPYGAVNISGCWFGLPVFISNPHFLDADPFYASKIDGMKPESDKHLTTAVLDPRTGFMLELKGRLQLNFYIQPSSHIRSYQNTRRMLFPIFWFDMHMRISKKSALLLRIMNNLQLYCHIFGASIIFISLLFFIWQPLKRMWNKRYTHHMQINTLADDDEDYSSKQKDFKTRDSLYSLPPNFPTLLYISHPRRSLPVIISQLDESEALNSCLDDNQREEFEQELETMVDHIGNKS